MITKTITSSILLMAIISASLTGVFAQTNINGAGSTFVFPLMDTWRVEYQKVKPDVNINYQSIGSGGGINQFLAKTVDFGATDAPLSAEEFQKAGNPVHIPVTIGSVVAAYNIPEIEDARLKLTGPILADIYLGKITKWNDPRIQELNPELPLPDEDILVNYRADGSGTTYVWTDYLSAVSSEWNSSLGKGKSIQWPAGLGSPGNEGVSSSIASTPYSIGYIELAYALTTGIPFASIQNKEGEFIDPSLESTQKAIEASALTLPKGDQPWSNVTMVNAQGQGSYPIASFVYVILYKNINDNPSIDQARAISLVNFIKWSISDGQTFGPALGYVPLPENVINLNNETIQMLTFNGNPLQ